MARKIGGTLIILFILVIGNAQHWIPLPNDDVLNVGGLRALEIRNDTLIAGGDVEAVGTSNSFGTFAWNGIDYIPFGPAFEGIFGVEGIANFQGNLVVGGLFDYEPIEDIEYQGLAQWNGMDWIGLDNLVENSDNHVKTIITYHDLLFASGYIGEMGGTEINFVGAWNGEEWINPGGVAFSPFLDFVVYNDTLIGGGAAVLGNDDGELANNILYWDEDTTWHEFNHGVYGSVFTMTVDSIENDLYVGGYFQQTGDGVPANCIARWDGEGWSEVETGLLINNNVMSLAIYRNQLYSSGLFEEIIRGEDTIQVRNVMRFDGYQWQTMDGGMDGGAFDMLEYQDELYLVGDIFSVGADSIPVNDIVRWYIHPDSVTWGVNVEEISSLENSKRFKLYPNPNDGQFYVEFESTNLSSGNLVVTDYNGRQLALEGVQNRRKVELHLEHLLAGVYLCSLVESGEIVETVRVVLE